MALIRFGGGIVQMLGSIGGTTFARNASGNYARARTTPANRLGESITLSGFNHYIRSNALLAKLGLTIVDAGPTVLAIPAMDPTFAITASEATDEISVAFDDTLEWLDEDGGYMFVSQGVPQNATRNFFAGPYRHMASIDGDSVTPPTTPDAQASVFTLIETQKVWCEARILRADGRLSNKMLASCIIAA